MQNPEEALTYVEISKVKDNNRTPTRSGMHIPKCWWARYCISLCEWSVWYVSTIGI